MRELRKSKLCEFRIRLDPCAETACAQIVERNSPYLVASVTQSVVLTKTTNHVLLQKAQDYVLRQRKQMFVAMKGELQHAPFPKEGAGETIAAEVLAIARYVRYHFLHRINYPPLLLRVVVARLNLLASFIFASL